MQKFFQLFHSINVLVKIIKVILEKCDETFDVKEIWEAYQTTYNEKLSQNTVRRVLREMLKEEMVEQVGYGDSMRGRKPMKYRVNVNFNFRNK